MQSLNVDKPCHKKRVGYIVWVEEIVTIPDICNVYINRQNIRFWRRNPLIYAIPEFLLTHWGRVTHICVIKLTIIGSDNGLSPGRRQAIIWTNAGILLIGPLGTNLSEIWIWIQTFSFKKMHLKMSFAKWRPFCLGLNVLKIHHQDSNPRNGHQGNLSYSLCEPFTIYISPLEWNSAGEGMVGVECLLAMFIFYGAFSDANLLICQQPGPETFSDHTQETRRRNYKEEAPGGSFTNIWI